MLDLIPAFLAALRALFRSRVDTSLEILTLRQQVAVLKRKRPRPSLNGLDRLFWTTLRHIWPRWSDVLVIVKPETVVGWHRAGWGAPKIHGELLKLGFEVSERTVARYLRRMRPRRGDPAKRWLSFLANHRELIVAHSRWFASRLYVLGDLEPAPLALTHGIAAMRCARSSTFWRQSARSTEFHRRVTVQPLSGLSPPKRDMIMAHPYVLEHSITILPSFGHQLQPRADRQVR